MKKISLIILFMFFIPSVTCALAGFAEKVRVYEYASDVFVESYNPADGCIDGHYCLYLKPHKDAPTLGEIESLPLDKISLPIEGSNIVVGKLNGSDSWVIFDLAQKTFILRDIDFSKSQEYLLSLGKSIPEFITTQNIKDHLSQTMDSILLHLFYKGIFISFFIFPFALLAFFIFTCVYIVKRIRRPKKQT